jgi:ubiquinone/menaquinone biosynthesis C-methylase UbiE
VILCSLRPRNRYLPLVRRMSVHPVAQKGFGSGSTNYDSARPDHQAPAVAKLLENLAIPHGGRVVEIGSGTGKFTAHLLNREENWEIICVEPSDLLLKNGIEVIVGHERNAKETAAECRYSCWNSL